MNHVKLTKDEIDFLENSNWIENVSDQDSFQQAAYAWDYLRSEEKLDTGVILKTHKILMLHQKLLPNERGYFREKQVGIYRENIIGVDPDSNKLMIRKEKIRDCMDYKLIREAIADWIVVANNVDQANNTGTWIKKDHIAFENIHPFVDGNGRVGRMLMNWQRLKVGLPILVIKNTEKKAYYEWFK